MSARDELRNELAQWLNRDEASSADELIDAYRAEVLPKISRAEVAVAIGASDIENVHVRLLATDAVMRLLREKGITK